MFRRMWENISQKFNEHLEEKRRIQKEFEEMQRHAEFQARIESDNRQRQEALEIVKKRALKDAQTKTGIKRLQAINRVQRLENNPDSFFSKLSQRTQKNLHRTEQNKIRNKMIREEARRMKQERLRRRQQERLMRTRKW